MSVTDYESLPENAVLPDSNPLGAYTDSQYLADEAALRYNITQQYQGLLQQLGYTNPSSGAYIPGRIMQDQTLKQAQDEFDRQMAVRDVTNQMQNAGTIFSGYRGTEQAKAEDPYVRDEQSSLLGATQGMSDAYTQAQQLISQYNIQNNQLLASAAARAAAEATQNPSTSTQPAPSPTTDPATVAAVAGTGGATEGTGGQQAAIGYIQQNPAVQQQLQTTGTAPAPIAMQHGGEVDRPMYVHMGERSHPGDRKSHEVVIPRSGLTAAQNRQLDKLAQAAGTRARGGFGVRGENAPTPSPFMQMPGATEGVGGATHLGLPQPEMQAPPPNMLPPEDRPDYYGETPAAPHLGTPPPTYPGEAGGGLAPALGQVPPQPMSQPMVAPIAPRVGGIHLPPSPYLMNHPVLGPIYRHLGYPHGPTEEPLRPRFPAVPVENTARGGPVLRPNPMTDPTGGILGAAYGRLVAQ